MGQCALNEWSLQLSHLIDLEVRSAHVNTKCMNSVFESCSLMWTFTNQVLHQDLRIPLVRTVFRERTAIHRTAVSDHQNPLMISLINPPNIRRLKRRWTFDETT
jgi:hypothetical protein